MPATITPMVHCDCRRLRRYALVPLTTRMATSAMSSSVASNSTRCMSLIDFAHGRRIGLQSLSEDGPDSVSQRRACRPREGHLQHATPTGYPEYVRRLQ